MSDSSSGSDLIAYLLSGGAGVVGRGMYHLHLFQQGKQKPALWLLCDMLLALGIGWTVLGLGDWIGLSFKTTQSLGILAGWGGPQFLDRLLITGLERFKSTPEDS